MATTFKSREAMKTKRASLARVATGTSNPLPVAVADEPFNPALLGLSPTVVEAYNALDAKGVAAAIAAESYTSEQVIALERLREKPRKSVLEPLGAWTEDE